MKKRIEIRNQHLPKNPRVFDVIVDENGNIQRYEMQNIRGQLFIDSDEVNRQIGEVLKNK